MAMAPPRWSRSTSRSNSPFALSDTTPGGRHTRLVCSPMPFTPAHVAAVLPLRRRGGLPFSALVVGSMIPDLPYYLPRRWVPTPATHSVAGIVTWDLLLGLAVWALWCALRPRVYDLAPQLLRSRWRRPESGFTGWSRAPLAVIIGAATHVLWDEFTHAGRFGATYFAVLAHTFPSPLGPLGGTGTCNMPAESSGSFSSSGPGTGHRGLSRATGSILALHASHP